MEKYKTGCLALHTNVDSRWTKDLNEKGKNYTVEEKPIFVI